VTTPVIYRRSRPNCHRRRQPRADPRPYTRHAVEELPLLDQRPGRIDADTRLVIATGNPQLGNRNDTVVYRTSGIQQALAGRTVMADGGYRGNPDVIIPYRKPADGSPLPAWKERPNREHRMIRAWIEHTLARMKCWKILRDYRRAGHTLSHAVSEIAQLHNIALTG
jgi:hypothetical protein